MAGIDDIRQQAQKALQRLTLGQKLSIGTTILVTAAVFILLFQWVTKPDYDLLFSNVDLKEAGAIIDALNAQSVPYKTSAGGTAILVPSNMVYEWRIKLTSDGVLSSGSIGYELFDESDLGISDFKQKVNLQRALEGELQRTIESFAGVTSARVHIVMPKERLFKEDQNPTTASVVINLSAGRQLRETQVSGIAILVAGSVEGMSPQNVKIVDSQMRILSSQFAEDSHVGLSSSQHHLQRQVEAHLANNAESMLANVLGENRAIVRVSAELDFDRIQSTVERFDPELTAILAEQRNEQSDSQGGQETGQREMSTTNYQVPRTVEHITSSVGNIKRLSIAVMIDDKREVLDEPEGGSTIVSTPRSADELDRFGSIVKKAVGFNETDRDDQFQIENIHFDVMDGLETFDTVSRFETVDYWLSVGRKVLPVILLAVFILIIRSQLRKIGVSRPGGAQARIPGAVAMAGGTSGMGAASGPPKPIPKIEDEVVPPETAESAKLLQQISTFVEEKPSQAVKLLRYWLLEE